MRTAAAVIAVAAAMLSLGSASLAQVIYKPAPTRVAATHPFNPKLSPHKVAILSSLQEPGCNVTVVVNNVNVDGDYDRAAALRGPVIVMPKYYTSHFYSVEAYKQHPLYFSKRELLPPRVLEDDENDDAATRESATTTPAAEKGTIIIIPKGQKVAVAR